MNLEEIKKQLTAIASSTGKKHVKVLVAELCNVIQALVEEIERIRQPSDQSLQKPLEEHRNKPSTQPPRLDQPTKYSPYFPEPDSKTRKRMGNAGDAE